MYTLFIIIYLVLWHRNALVKGWLIVEEGFKKIELKRIKRFPNGVGTKLPVGCHRASKTIFLFILIPFHALRL